MKIIEAGNIFDSEAQTLVNTVNCMGVMGKGLALQFKKRYPDMFEAYQKICKHNLLDIGKLWLFKTEHRWILNFPTKYDWRNPSTEYYLQKGLEKFIQTYKQRSIQSIAFPLLGASNGGIDPEVSLKIMVDHLQYCEIPVYIYIKYQPIDKKLF
jgi:O-acetyl-ADP-ribose deacetylase (regulator of RNase III)